MGFFRRLLGDAADEFKKNLEDARKEMSINLEEMRRNAMAGFTNSSSNSRDNDEEDDEEPKILLGDFHDGVLTIREGITELDDESLEHYKRIRKIIFPASLERLDSNVIDEQERLEELDFSKVTKLKTIPDDFISGENKIHKLIIPNGVTEVGDGFLGEAKSGAEIFVPASVRKLGYITGNNDNDMTVYLFAANIDISDVEEDVKTLYVLPQYYGWYAKALKKCDSEARLREMPTDRLDSYGHQVAASSAIPKQVDKPISKEYVETEEDKYATSIDIPEGVTIIPEYCFSRRSSLESITLPSTIKQIGKYAFWSCSALTSIDIPEGVTIIPDGCFKCSSLESITLPSTIKQIGESAFQGCSALTSINIPEGVTIISHSCFEECSSLESITLPSTIKQIGDYAFSACSALTSIDIPEEVTVILGRRLSTIKQIGGFAFSACSALTSIDIPEGVTIIGYRCFDECSSLESITLPSTIKEISEYAFAQCNKLKTISIPNGCERLEELGGFDSETRIFLPPSLRSIDVISDRLLIYCFAPQLKELEIFKECKEFYVLPQYLDLYKSQAEAEEVEIDIKPMPDEYLYFYDN